VPKVLSVLRYEKKTEIEDNFSSGNLGA